jgi:hypothetical protein
MNACTWSELWLRPASGRNGFACSDHFPGRKIAKNENLNNEYFCFILAGIFKNH